jgi:predicted secreted protein
MSTPRRFRSSNELSTIRWLLRWTKDDGEVAEADLRTAPQAFLRQRKTVIATALLGATFLGLFTFLTTALNAALFSGELLSVPALAALLKGKMKFGSRPHVSLDKSADPASNSR